MLECGGWEREVRNIVKVIQKLLVDHDILLCQEMAPSLLHCFVLCVGVLGMRVRGLVTNL